MRYRRQVLLGAAAAIGLIFVGVATLYLRPMSVITEVIRFGLFRKGFQSRYAQVCISSGCYRVHYYVGGHGPPLVLLHGIGSSGDSWAKLAPVIRDGGLRVYLPDLLGFGRSEKPDVNYSIALQAELVHGFLKQQGIPATDLGGVSMGGWIALRVAALYGPDVTRLVLIDTAGTTFTPTFDGALFAPQNAAQLQLLLDHLMPRAPSIPHFIADDMLRMARPTGWVIQRAMESMFTKRDLMDNQLHLIQVPTLILWGEEDQVIPLSAGRYLNKKIENSNLRVFEGCGHLLLEVCGSRLEQPILSFLQDKRRP